MTLRRTSQPRHPGPGTTRRASIKWAAFALSTVALAGCAKAGATQLDSSVLTIGAITPPLTFDPSGSEWGNRSPYYQSVFDTLLLATTSGEIEPFLAESWSYNDDNTVLTLKLRNDVTFTDGTKLTGDVVRQNLERFKVGKSRMPGTSPASSRSPLPTTRRWSSPSTPPSRRCSTT